MRNGLVLPLYELIELIRFRYFSRREKNVGTAESPRGRHEREVLLQFFVPNPCDALIVCR